MADDGLGASAWPDVGSPVLVVPVGSFEQHGPHLPLDTDTRIAIALSEALCAAEPACALGPTLTVTASGEHHGFPGTLSIGTDVTAQVLIELARSADWAAGVVYVNGHGGNALACRQAQAVLAEEGRAVLVWAPHVRGGDLHAGATETSLMLHLAPHLVRRAAAVAGPQPTLAALVTHGVRALSPSGVLGEPAKASAGAGSALLAALADDLVATVRRWLG